MLASLWICAVRSKLLGSWRALPRGGVALRIILPLLLLDALDNAIFLSVSNGFLTFSTIRTCILNPLFNLADLLLQRRQPLPLPYHQLHQLSLHYLTTLLRLRDLRPRQVDNRLS